MISRPLLVRALSLLAFTFACCGEVDEGRAEDRPNFLWITCEDISANLGCYGDPDAITPHLDRFAERSVLYTQARSTAGVCAPSRSGLITGMYPSSLGTQYMRCRNQPPEYVRAYSAYLRDAGYYCTNNSKTDYNFIAADDSWDESSGQAHWRNRGEDQPFFAIFNFTSTHESKIRQAPNSYAAATAALTPDQRRDPSAIRIPAYLPDTPVVRRDWANVHELITAFDLKVAEVLQELEDAGLAEDTIVWFYSDHGVGLPRGKRWLYESGMHVPLIIHFPEKYRHLAPSEPGTKTDRLVSFIDFGPTVLSLAGIELPAHLQGRAFLGEQGAPPRRFLHGARDRTDERPDVIRAVTDGRYKYIRNFRPDLPYFQYISYMYQMPTMQVWQQLADDGELSGPPAAWMRPGKPIEELYDLRTDPDEVVNLADSPEHAAALETMRSELRRWMFEIRDVALIPEAELFARRGEQSAYDWTRSTEDFHQERYFDAADAAVFDAQSEAARRALLQDEDSVVRFWGAVSAIHAGGDQAVEQLRGLLSDENPSVRIVAADGLVRLGADDAETHAVLVDALQDDNPWVRQRAIVGLDHMEAGAAAYREEIAAAGGDDGPDPTMANSYFGRVRNRILNKLKPR